MTREEKKTMAEDLEREAPETPRNGEVSDLPEEEAPSLELTEDDEGGAEEGEEPVAASEGGGPATEEEELIRMELDQLKDQHLRLAADFENYRKRVSNDLASGWVRAQAELAGSLLEGLDDLQRVSQFTTEDATLETLIEGVDMVERKLLKALTTAGLEIMDPAGEVFDPNTMEAMMRVPTEEEGQDNTVHQVFQKGYVLKGQLVRPARVSVYRDDD